MNVAIDVNRIADISYRRRIQIVAEQKQNNEIKIKEGQKMIYNFAKELLPYVKHEIETRAEKGNRFALIPIWDNWKLWNNIYSSIDRMGRSKILTQAESKRVSKFKLGDDAGHNSEFVIRERSLHYLAIFLLKKKLKVSTVDVYLPVPRSFGWKSSVYAVNFLMIEW